MDWEPEVGEKPWSVGALTARIRALLEGELGEMWIEGEVSNLRRQASGHWYFTLKDAEAQISAVMFRGDAAKIRGAIEEGLSVLAYGRVSVYPPRGNYQLVVRVLRPEGEGLLRQRFEALRAKLESEGLFDPARKRPIPPLPRTLAVITSPSGAAVKDFLSILRRRGWLGTVRLLPVRVQGKEAAGEIAAMLERTNREALGDLIVLTRGGGSLEDLWPFNEEIVARAVAASALPLISAVGHEIDFTLSDFAADQRAETPSAAAELISSEFVDYRAAVGRVHRRLRQGVAVAFERLRLTLGHLGQRLKTQSPDYRLEQAWQRLDELAQRKERLEKELLRRHRERLKELGWRLAQASPEPRLQWAREHLHHLRLRLHQASPDSALRRGYAMVLRADGQLISRRADLPAGAAVRVRWADGEATLGPPGRARSRRGAPPPAAQQDLPFEEPKPDA